MICFSQTNVAELTVGSSEPRPQGTMCFVHALGALPGGHVTSPSQPGSVGLVAPAADCRRMSESSRDHPSVALEQQNCPADPQTPEQKQMVMAFRYWFCGSVLCSIVVVIDTEAKENLCLPAQGKSNVR